MGKEVIKNMLQDSMDNKKVMIIVHINRITMQPGLILITMLLITNSIMANNITIRVMVNKSLQNKLLLLIQSSNNKFLQKVDSYLLFNKWLQINNTIRNITINITSNIIRVEQRLKVITQHIINNSNSIMLECLAMNSLSQILVLIQFQDKNKSRQQEEISRFSNKLINSSQVNEIEMRV